MRSNSSETMMHSPPLPWPTSRIPKESTALVEVTKQLLAEHATKRPALFYEVTAVPRENRVSHSVNPCDSADITPRYSYRLESEEAVRILVPASKMGWIPTALRAAAWAESNGVYWIRENPQPAVKAACEAFDELSAGAGLPFLRSRDVARWNYGKCAALLTTRRGGRTSSRRASCRTSSQTQL